MAKRTAGVGNQPGEIQNRQSEKGIFRLSRFQIEAPPKARKMGVEIAHGRQGTEKVQGKHTGGHWSDWQKAKPMEHHAVQRYGVRIT